MTPPPASAARYEVIMASADDLDGMSLELWDRRDRRILALSVFCSDVDGSFTLERHRDDVPPEVEAWFRDEARRRLPRSADA